MAKDYGRRPQVSQKRYPDFIKSKASKAIWDRITETFPALKEFERNRRNLGSVERSFVRFIKQSEFKKPYSDLTYPEMEMEWEGLPGFRRNDVDLPWNMGNPIDAGDVGGEVGTTCLFDVTCEDADDCCYCPGSKKTINVSGTNPIISFYLAGADEAYTLNVVKGLGTNNVTIELTTHEDESGQLRLWTVMRCYTDGGGYIDGESNLNMYQCDDSGCPYFFITLTRGDGTTIDDTLLTNFYAKGKTSGINHALDYEYLGAGEFKVWITGANGYDDNDEYWLSYRTKIGYSTWYTNTQYPSKYQDSDKESAGDAITYGTFSDTTAYFDITTGWDTTPIAWDDMDTVNLYDENTPCSGLDAQFKGVSDHPSDPIGSWRVHETGSQIRWETEIESNLHYSLRMKSAGTTGRRVHAMGALNAAFVSCLGLTCTGSPPVNCECDFVGITWSDACDTVAAYLDENIDVVETVSDGLDANTYNLSYAGIGATFAAYDDTVIITSPSVSGKTHYFEYSIEADDISGDYDCPGCTAVALLHKFGGIDNTSTAYKSAIDLTVALSGVTLT